MKKAKVKKYWNSQKWYECQLVTIWNAAIYHGRKVPRRYGIQYTRDCVKSGAFFGIWIHTSFLKKKLKLKFRRCPKRMSLATLAKNLPCEHVIKCRNRSGGLHSVLIVGVDLKNRTITVTNYNKFGDNVSVVKWYKFKREISHTIYYNTPRRWLKK